MLAVIYLKNRAITLEELYFDVEPIVSICNVEN